MLRGWLAHDAADRVESVSAVSLFGRRVSLDYPLPTVSRPDVVEAVMAKIATHSPNCGFVTHAEVPAIHPDDRLWFVEIRMKSGSIVRAPFRLGPEASPRRAIEILITWASDHAVDRADLFKRALAVPLKRLWARLLADRPTPVETSFGQLARSPEVSIIVPLYGRIDFLRHQIASFSNDPEFRAKAAKTELIYVLDDPRVAQDLAIMGRLVFDTYGIPFRIVDLCGNFGYSTANNAGVATAAGRRILLMNSDVLPKRPGWVSQMSRLYASLPGCGILGCRLLFEDGSIQHAGMDFRRSTELADAWINEHPSKGLAVAFDSHQRAEVVPAVTGACLMIARALYLELGGLSNEFVRGDFEDSDLCLKARAAGYRTYYAPEIELYHLERQSMRLVADGREDWRHGLTLFNMWQHAERWGAAIADIVANNQAH